VGVPSSDDDKGCRHATSSEEVVRPKREKASVTQNGAGNAWIYSSGANNNPKTNSNFVLPVFDYHILMMPHSSRHPSVLS
jgi:hypothetical protein